MSNVDHKTQKITIVKKTVKVENTREEDEYVKAKKEGNRYILPWEAPDGLLPPDGWTNFKSFFTPDSSGVPSDEVLDFCIYFLYKTFVAPYKPKKVNSPRGAAALGHLNSVRKRSAIYFFVHSNT